MKNSFSILYLNEFDYVAPQLNPSETVIYLALVSIRNSKTHQTPPIGIALLTQKTGYSERTVFRNLKALITKGFITKKSSGNRSIYSFPLLGILPNLAVNPATDGRQNNI